ncbi:monocarboxylate transporter 6 isoform X4 [Macaca fascicularis]|uniref:monocarboxylate transporter 6 isoform X4 n=2 Tax=Macaca fascicularis TaxID=9541 RepID=UPI003D156DA7
MPQALERADGSWAWVVLLATMVTQGLTLGFPTCIGIFFTDLQWEFQASNSQTSWIPSILMAVLHMAGPLCSILVGRFGCRVTTMLGGVLASLGMVASSFSRNLSQLYFTAGFITGLGMCFSFQSSVTVLGFYFVRRRVLANALASMGVSLGITLWPLLSRYLLEDLGWRGTFLVFGGVFLHCCICGAIMRPVATSVAPETKECPPPPPETPALGCVAACGRTIQRHLAFDILRHNTGYCVFSWTSSLWISSPEPWDSSLSWMALLSSSPHHWPGCSWTPPTTSAMFSSCPASSLSQLPSSWVAASMPCRRRSRASGLSWQMPWSRIFSWKPKMVLGSSGPL